MQKINKTKARKLFEARATIWLLPCKIRPDNFWMQASAISLDTELSFEGAVNAYEYYNCNSYTGTYASYYVEESEVNR